MDNNLLNMDNDPGFLKPDSLKGSPQVSPGLNKDSENPINPKLLHTPHRHIQHTLKKLRREKMTQPQTHPLAEMAESQT
jgi:hypothetical protein